MPVCAGVKVLGLSCRRTFDFEATFIVKLTDLLLAPPSAMFDS